MQLIALWARLQASHGNFCLVHGVNARAVVTGMADQIGGPLVSVGRELTLHHPDGWRDPQAHLKGYSFLLDLDVLFWPDVGVEPLRMLRSLARERPIIAQWPGTFVNDRLKYSQSGRTDHYDEPRPPGVVILSSRSTTFPDELPYLVERT